MKKYKFKSITEIEKQSQMNKKYDFKPCEECMKKESQTNNDKIVILKKEIKYNE